MEIRQGDKVAHGDVLRGLHGLRLAGAAPAGEFSVAPHGARLNGPEVCLPHRRTLAGLYDEGASGPTELRQRAKELPPALPHAEQWPNSAEDLAECPLGARLRRDPPDLDEPTVAVPPHHAPHGATHHKLQAPRGCCHIRPHRGGAQPAGRARQLAGSSRGL